MSQSPKPLPVGTVLGDRFEIESVLGQGGFGIAYGARDLVRKDTAAIKELAPIGSVRQGLILNLAGDGSQAHRVRQSFLEEARHLSRLTCPGILPIRAVFTENGTAYYATEFLEEAISLEKVCMREGRMEPDGAMDILFQLLETLEAVHAKGIIHRDIKPNNILLSPGGQAYLIDFGSAREWQADVAITHTVLYTPGYAPIEQLSERGRRGPATDIYALCATMYRLLTGTTPLPSPDRVDGREMPPLSSLRADLEPSVAAALERGLHIRYHDRPQSITHLRELLSKGEEEAEAPGSLASYDAQLVRLKTFNFERRQCPACRGILDQPKPLRRWGCPVCRDGTIRMRHIESRLCPSCQAGTLHRIDNTKPLAFCPACKNGHLAQRKKGLLHRQVHLDCLQCKSVFLLDEGQVVVESSPNLDTGTTHSPETWRSESGRADVVWNCDGCDAQYDVLEDGRWEQINPPAKRYRQLYSDEWARVAAGLAPGTGNAACDLCNADYFVDGERLTLLSVETDDFGFADEHLGRLLTLEDVRWLGINKESPSPGFVCGECGTELDHDGDYLRLVRTKHRRLLRHVGEPRKLIDWHRVALGLPEVHEEEDFRTDVLSAIVGAYELGEIGFETDLQVIWKGPAVREGAKGTLSATKEEIVFGTLLKKFRAPTDALISAIGKGDTLDLRFSGELAPTSFQITPVELTVQFSKSAHTVTLDASNLARRLQVEIASRSRTKVRETS